MPIFYSRHTKVYLSIPQVGVDSDTPLTRQRGPATDTALVSKAAPTVGATGKGPSSTGHSILSEQAFRSDDGMSTSFLGPHKEVPFFMVRAGKELFHEDTGANPTRTKVTELSSASPARQSSCPLERIKPDYGKDENEVQRDAPGSENRRPCTQDGKKSTSVFQGQRQGAVRTDDTVESWTSLGRSPFTSHLDQSGQLLPRFVLPPTAHPAGSTSSNRGASQRALDRCPLKLTVELSKGSFLSPIGRGPHRQDAHILVLFNGELTASKTVSGRALVSTSEMGDLTQEFTGRRVDRATERRWIVVPSGQNADGTLRWSRRTKAAAMDAKGRWASISEALAREADQWGTQVSGRRTMTGEYLAELAKLPMPDEMNRIQKPGGQKFGVVDVLVVLGRGHKVQPYMREPMRALDPKRLEAGPIKHENSEDLESGNAESTPNTKRSNNGGGVGIKDNANGLSTPVGSGVGRRPPLPSASVKTYPSKARAAPRTKPRRVAARQNNDGDFPSVLGGESGGLGSLQQLGLVPASGAGPSSFRMIDNTSAGRVIHTASSSLLNAKATDAIPTGSLRTSRKPTTSTSKRDKAGGTKRAVPLDDPADGSPMPKRTRLAGGTNGVGSVAGASHAGGATVLAPRTPSMASAEQVPAGSSCRLRPSDGGMAQPTTRQERSHNAGVKATTDAGSASVSVSVINGTPIADGKGKSKSSSRSKKNQPRSSSGRFASFKPASQNGTPQNISVPPRPSLCLPSPTRSAGFEGPWSPGLLCEDSFISYADDADWKRATPKSLSSSTVRASKKTQNGGPGKAKDDGGSRALSGAGAGESASARAAEGGRGQEDNAKAAYGPCRPERVSVFEETAVLMGVRFIVG